MICRHHVSDKLLVTICRHHFYDPSWSDSEKTQQVRVKTIFLLGKDPKKGTKKSEIEQENEIHGDILMARVEHIFALWIFFKSNLDNLFFTVVWKKTFGSQPNISWFWWFISKLGNQGTHVSGFRSWSYRKCRFYI